MSECAGGPLNRPTQSTWDETTMLFRKLALSASMTLAPLMGAASAADLGKDAAVDLDERLAFLEQSLVKRGNSKMVLTLTGQVDKAYIWGSNTIGPKQYGVVDGPAPTMIAISGEGKIGKDLKAGILIELQLESRPLLNLSTTGDAHTTIRTANAYIESNIVGRLTIGHGSMASDKTGEVSLSEGARLVSPMLSLGPLSNTWLFGYDLPTGPNAARRDMVRWDSPAVAGFMLSASLANPDQGPVNVGFATTGRAADVALKYAGESQQWRFATAVSYRDEQQSMSPISFAPLTRSTVAQGSASLMNLPTGLFVNFAAAHVTNDVIWSTFDLYQVQAGIEKKLNSFGATTVFAEFGEMVVKGGPQPKIYGFGLNQNIEGIATDLYLDYKRFDTGPLGGPQIDTVMGGMRIKF